MALPRCQPQEANAHAARLNAHRPGARRRATCAAQPPGRGTSSFSLLPPAARRRRATWCARQQSCTRPAPPPRGPPLLAGARQAEGRRRAGRVRVRRREGSRHACPASRLGPSVRGGGAGNRNDAAGARHGQPPLPPPAGSPVSLPPCPARSAAPSCAPASGGPCSGGGREREGGSGIGGRRGGRRGPGTEGTHEGNMQAARSERAVCLAPQGAAGPRLLRSCRAAAARRSSQPWLGLT
jgi:hypothetical protein